jgi:hypothetical protein
MSLDSIIEISSNYESRVLLPLLLLVDPITICLLLIALIIAPNIRLFSAADCFF